MDPVEDFRISEQDERDAFLNTGRMNNALTLADLVFNDPMIGIKDGKNSQFELHHKPVSPNCIKIYYNGKVMDKNAYHVNGKTITMVGMPMYGDNVYADYISICARGEKN